MEIFCSVNELISSNSKLVYEYYTNSTFSNKVSNIELYRGIKYNFKQFHRSNYNPTIDIDLNRTFKITLKKNNNNEVSFYINDMEKYIPNLLIT